MQSARLSTHVLSRIVTVVVVLDTFWPPRRVGRMRPGTPRPGAMGMDTLGAAADNKTAQHTHAVTARDLASLVHLTGTRSLA